MLMGYMQLVGKICKQWPSIVEEHFTNADNFEIQCEPVIPQIFINKLVGNLYNILVQLTKLQNTLIEQSHR